MSRRWRKPLRLHVLILFLFTLPAFAAQPPSKLIKMPEPVPDDYLIELEPSVANAHVPAVAKELAAKHSALLRSVWPDGAHGFWAHMTAARAEALSHDPRVKYVFENAYMHSSGTADVGGDDPRWNVDRIDQRSGTNGSYQYCGTGSGTTIYIIDSGVDQHQPDFGTRLKQGADFTDDGNTSVNPCNQQNIVGTGHGTAVATIAAGGTLGVARGADVMAVRVMDCNGIASEGQFADAMSWLRRANSRTPVNPDWQNNQLVRPGIVSISQFATVSTNSPPTPYENQIKAAIDAGFIVVVSANNQNTKDAVVGLASMPAQIAQIPGRLSYSNTALPSSFQNFNARVISVGGTQLNNGADVRWICQASPNYSDVVCPPNTKDYDSNLPYGSNYGMGIDIWAPAYEIQAGHMAELLPVFGEDPWRPLGVKQWRRPMAYPVSETQDVNGKRWFARSGTSFSAPLVAGVLARLASEDGTIFNQQSLGLTQDRAWQRLQESATLLDPIAANLGTGSTNRFIYAGGNVMTLQPATRVIESGVATTISVASTGSSPTYTLYAGPSGTTTTLLAGPQSSGSFSVNATGVNGYWVRASSTCTVDSSTTTSDSATVWVITKPVLTATASSSSISLSWTSGGSSATRYDVFRRISGQAFGANPIAQTPSLSYVDTGVVSGTAYEYKVAARHPPETPQIDSNIVAATATTTIVPPARVFATNNNGVVTIEWYEVTGADGYKVERKVEGSDWVLAKTVSGGSVLTTTDNPGLIGGGMVLYRVRATSGTAQSDPSQIDLAYMKNFTDDSLYGPSPGMAIKAVHITEIRQAINALRAVAGAAAVYGPSQLDPSALSGQAIDDAEFTLLMSNINQARDLVPIYPPGIEFHTTPQSGFVIDHQQMADLRNALK